VPGRHGGLRRRPSCSSRCLACAKLSG
jgi:hypothetical protein